MAIHCEFIDLVIPIENIDKVYPGGFKKYKEENINGFYGKLWHDEFLFRDGAMGPDDMHYLVQKWEERGLVGVVEREGIKEWKDLCVLEGLFGGPTLKCDWLEYDHVDRCVYMKGKPKGEIVGGRRRQGL